MWGYVISMHKVANKETNKRRFLFHMEKPFSWAYESFSYSLVLPEALP